MTEIPKLVQSDGYFEQTADGGHRLVSALSKQPIATDEIASVIWRMCDGSRDAIEISQEIASFYPQDSAAVSTDVINALEKLAEFGALRARSGESGFARGAITPGHGKILVACYCEPANHSLNWQLHALYQSFLDLQHPDFDFRVTIPSGAEGLIDPRIPYRFAESIKQTFKHPMLKKHGFNGYPYANHFLSVSEEDTAYDYILACDVDTLLLPALADTRPAKFLTGGGGYKTDVTHQRLSEFAQRQGYENFGRHSNIGPTWYGDSSLVVKSAKEVLKTIPILLSEADWRDTSWPDWWIGVLSLYSSEIVLNELVPDLEIRRGVLDAHTDNKEPNDAIHMHMWHTSNYSEEFSKFAFNDGVYDREDIALTGKAGFALEYARRGRLLGSAARLHHLLLSKDADATAGSVNGTVRGSRPDSGAPSAVSSLVQLFRRLRG